MASMAVLNAWAVAVLSVLLLGSVNYTQGSLLCYQCLDDPDQNTDVVTDCLRLAACASNEICYTEVHVRGSQLKVKAGCRSKLECARVTVGRRDNDVICTQCCDSDFCNAKICDQKLPPNHTPCLGCKDLEEGKPCEQLQYCTFPEVCSVELRWAYEKKGFATYACATENLCPTPQKRLAFSSVGILHPVCRNCCDGEMCNLNLTCPFHH